jgi:hypothetical protein
VWAWLLLGGIPALAQETPETSAASESSWAYLTLMTGPLERVEASSEELGVSLPGMLRRESLEKEFPFIGPGGLRGTGFIGTTMGPGEPGAPTSSVLMLFPINPDVAPLQAFTARGAKPLPGSSDTVRIKGTFFRRTPGFLLLSPNAQADITEFDPEAVEERLSAPGLLAEIDVNLDRWRQTDPSTFYRLLTRSEDKESAQGDSSHVTALGRGLGTRIYERLLDRMRFTLLDAGSALRLRVELEPLAPGELAPLPRPAFPSGAIGRVDIAYASTESSQWIQGLTEQFMNAAEKDNLFAEAERARVDVDQVRALFKETFELFWSADAISIALEPVKGKLLYHQVNQYRSPAGFTERVAAVVRKFNELDQQPGRRAAGFGLTTTSASGVRSSRLTFPGSKLTIDFAESGTTVRIVAASDNKRRLPALLELPDDGTLSSCFSGEFDTNAAVDAYLATGGHLPFPLRLRTRESLRGQLISWSTRAEGTAAVVDIDVPKPLARAFLQLMESRAFEVDASEP